MDHDPFDFVTPSHSFSFYAREGGPTEPEVWELVDGADVLLAIADAFRYAPESCIEWMKEHGFGVGLERGAVSHWESRLRDSFQWGRRFRCYRRKCTSTTDDLS